MGWSVVSWYIWSSWSGVSLWSKIWGGKLSLGMFGVAEVRSNISGVSL